MEDLGFGFAFALPLEQFRFLLCLGKIVFLTWAKINGNKGVRGARARKKTHTTLHTRHLRPVHFVLLANIKIQNDRYDATQLLLRNKMILFLRFFFVQMPFGITSIEPCEVRIDLKFTFLYVIVCTVHTHLSLRLRVY